MSEPAQHITTDAQGHRWIQDDWYPMPLPDNLVLEEKSYPDTAYSFTTFYSEQPVGCTIGYGSGNYGHGVFNTGAFGVITIGKFVVLQCTRLICNRSIIIGDHCMFSWGSVITDSWLSNDSLSKDQKRAMLMHTASSNTRHLEFIEPKPVIIQENAWIGFEAIILPGVTIGRGAIIGSKAIIDKDVPPYAVMVGNPARIIKYLEPTDTEDIRQQALRECIQY
jgi:acetyltransferase-like isoleucine patch superfamily enzyme